MKTSHRTLSEKGWELVDEIQLEHRLSGVEDRSKSNSHRLDEVEKRQDRLDELVTSVSLIAQRQDSMEKDVCEMKCDVKTLIHKPSKRWEGVVDKVLYAIIAALIGYIAVKLGIQ